MLTALALICKIREAYKADNIELQSAECHEFEIEKNVNEQHLWYIIARSRFLMKVLLQPLSLAYWQQE